MMPANPAAPGRYFRFFGRFGAMILAFSWLVGCASHGGNPANEVSPDLQKALLEARENRVPLPYDQPQEAQEYFVEKRRPSDAEGLPMRRYAAARRAMVERALFDIESRAPMSSLAVMRKSGPAAMKAALGGWEELGPGNVGGRTRAFVFHPDFSTNGILYAAGVAGGVWKSSDSGASWTALADDMANLAVSSLVIDPGDANVLYAGTGEGYFAGDSARGAGIFKTLDGGVTWQQLASTNNADFYYVNDLVVSQHDSDRVYAATRSGLWRSEDGGASWSLELTDPGAAGCLDLEARSDQPTDFLLASCGSFEPSTVYRNTDAGGSGVWAPVLPATVGGDPFQGRTTLAIAPSDQDVMYALSATLDVASPLYLGFYKVSRSDDGGATWTTQVDNTAPVPNNLLLSNPIFGSFIECGFDTVNFYFNQGWYDNTIAVDPADPDRVWAGGVDLFRSDDAGQSWGVASFWWFSFFSPYYAHADQHRLIFHPDYDGITNNTLFVGNDGGLYRTDNARDAVVTGPLATCSFFLPDVNWTTNNNGYAVTQFYHGLPFPDGESYFGGTQDNGTQFSSDTLGPLDWKEISGGDGGWVAVDPTNTQVMYAENTGISLRKSVNGRFGPFVTSTAGISDSGGLFIVPFVMDPSEPDRLWTGGHFIWRTDDAATTWTRASTQLAFGSRAAIGAIAVAPDNPDRVLLGIGGSRSSEIGTIFRTDTATTNDATSVWSSVQPREGWLSWLTFDPHDEDVAYATYSTFGGTHVWKSLDGGVTWNGLDGSGTGALPDIPVHALVVDPHRPLTLYLGTDLGVFVSPDGGDTWTPARSNFPNTITEALAIDDASSVNPRLFAFTHGRGAWRTDLPGPAPGGFLEVDCPRGCPGRCTLEVSGGQPNSRVMLLRSDDFGESTITRAGCHDAAIDLEHPGSYGIVHLDGQGNGSKTRQIAPPFCGDFLQALDVTICEATNPVRLP